jgi:hypothetical protein
MYCGTIKTFEELRDYLWEEKTATLEMLADRLPELSRFEQGRFVGQIQGFQEVMDVLRNSLKYGDVE